MWQCSGTTLVQRAITRAKAIRTPVLLGAPRWRSILGAHEMNIAAPFLGQSPRNIMQPNVRSGLLLKCVEILISVEDEDSKR